MKTSTLNVLIAQDPATRARTMDARLSRTAFDAERLEAAVETAALRTTGEV